MRRNIENDFKAVHQFAARQTEFQLHGETITFQNSIYKEQESIDAEAAVSPQINIQTSL